jgi:AcrR family transcriptional regulator
VVAERHGYHHGNLRQALIEAGLELTRRRGAAALVLRELTRHVGVSPNAAYRHFEDSDSLMAAVADEIRMRMASRMRSEDAPVSPKGKLRAIGLGYIGFALAEPGWFDVASASTRGHLPNVDVPGPARLLSSALDELVEAGELAPENRPGAHWPCWAAVHGFALLAVSGPLHGQPADVVQAAAERTVDAMITGLLAG